MSDLDSVRLLIADLGTGKKQLLTDAQIESFLALNNGRIRRAAADALDTIATSEVLLSKKIRTQDLSTDGPAVSAELRARAAQLRKQDDEDDAENGDFAFFFAGGYPSSRAPEFTEYPRQFWGL